MNLKFVFQSPINAIELAFKIRLSKNLPHTLKHLAIYLDRNAILHKDTTSLSYPSLGHKLAFVTHRGMELEVLALSFIVDAGDFFGRYDVVNKFKKDTGA